MARDYSLKMEEKVGYHSEYTHKSKEKLINVLVKCEKGEEALSEAKRYLLKVE